MDEKYGLWQCPFLYESMAKWRRTPERYVLRFKKDILLKIEGEMPCLLKKDRKKFQKC